MAVFEKLHSSVCWSYDFLQYFNPSATIDVFISKKKENPNKIITKEKSTMCDRREIFLELLALCISLLF